MTEIGATRALSVRAWNGSLCPFSAIVIENMPGAGSFAGFPLDSAVGGSGKTNAAEFHYVGRVNTSAWIWSTGRLRQPMAGTLPESAVSDEDRAAPQAIASTAEMGRSIISGPDVSPRVPRGIGSGPLYKWCKIPPSSPPATNGI
jgi:hypothetical protein